MKLKLTNTLTRAKEDFTPLKPGEVTLYTCGPTVYNYAHIGNLRTYIFEDVLRRTLELAGYNVQHVMNVTDVGHLVSDADEGEDKLETGAEREGKTVWEVAESYTKAFQADIAKLNILPATKLEKATDHIQDQLDMIQILMDTGFAYQTEQAIYFDVTKVKDYGKLSRQKLEDKEVGARDEVVTDSDKHHPQDFALWFFTVGHFENHTMRWESPWGEGFPGWHLECSAIIKAALGDTIDIHTGGVDHIGTHHTNEIAQSESANGKPLANYWLHGEFLLVDGGKMAKSKGNFYTLQDLADKGFSPLAFRLLILQAHYRSELNFTLESLKAAGSFLAKLYALADRQFQYVDKNVNPDFEARVEGMLGQFDAAISDDLNTSKALAALSEFADWASTAPIAARDQEGFEQALEHLESILGLGLTKRSDITTEQKDLIAQRSKAKEHEDYKLADSLRQQLEDQGISIKDTPNGPLWSRIS